jgi:hypothetical protein
VTATWKKMEFAKLFSRFMENWKLVENQDKKTWKCGPPGAWKIVKIFSEKHIRQKNTAK